jgi:benzil reductase ((S)-benzoin forming)
MTGVQTRVTEPRRPAVFITGASAGIGLALARAFVARGDRVLALQRRPSPLAGTPGYREQLHDLADLQGIVGKLRALLEGTHQLDRVILNAAISAEPRDIGETSLETIQHLMNVNTWANKTILDTTFSLGIEVKQVVGISSGAAVRGNRGWNGYSLSKAAFVMLLDLYAAEREGTHFCSLAPGIVHTAMQQSLDKVPPGDVQKFPSVQRLLAARGTDAMPTPEVAAPRLLAAFDAALTRRSGAFLDVRELG